MAAATRAGMEELGRLLEAASPQAVVVVTPHNVHIPGSMGVVVAGRVAGRLAGAPQAIALDVPTEMTLAWLVLQSLIAASVPAVGVSFGSNNPADAVAPMDWGVLIPLWFMGGRQKPPVPLVVVTPARDLRAADHIKAGGAIASAAAASELRVAFIASADHGHAHDPKGPYGYDPAAKEYDQAICELVRTDHLDRLPEVSLELVEKAKADSWWQMLMLHGATVEGWRGRLLSYEAPTYFGMLTAVYEPVESANAPARKGALPVGERSVEPANAPLPSPARKSGDKDGPYRSLPVGERERVSRRTASQPRKRTARRTRAR